MFSINCLYPLDQSVDRRVVGEVERFGKSSARQEPGTATGRSGRRPGLHPTSPHWYRR